ncbi:unnamed protein product [Nippostrongylus brasiliensis]|uniref:Uncharacterized protein n=1 Tax=Nippostrongylus brasiliensis TaxID=27835 RepID=A0A0N4YLR7_NIPBR|nr:unnamed protein product [Nippostrongylus brasiliensis]
MASEIGETLSVQVKYQSDTEDEMVDEPGDDPGSEKKGLKEEAALLRSNGGEEWFPPPFWEESFLEESYWPNCRALEELKALYVGMAFTGRYGGSFSEDNPPISRKESAPTKNARDSLVRELHDIEERIRTINRQLEIELAVNTDDSYVLKLVAKYLSNWRTFNIEVAEQTRG